MGNCWAACNIPVVPDLLDTYRGERRRWTNLRCWEQMFIVWAVLTLLVLISLTLYRVVTVSDKNADFTFGLVLLVSFVFCIYYAAYGVLQERSTLIVPLCVDVVLICIYLLLNYLYGKRDNVKLVRMCFALADLLLVVMPGVYLSWRYYPIGTILATTVGAGASQELCQTLYVFFDLLLFDLQLAISMTLYVMTSRQQFDIEACVILVVGLFMAFTWFAMFHKGVKNESKGWTITAFILFWIQPAYVCFKMCETKGAETTDFPGLALPVFACGAATLFVRCMVVAFGVIAYRNFNKGLRGEGSVVAQQYYMSTFDSRV